MQTISVDRLVGQTLGSYRVERLMGQGRLSAVYFAQNTLTGLNGALTLFLVPEHFSQDAHARFIQRFRKEGTALTALQHPHILRVHESGEHQGYPYLVTPYMTNGSLADVVKRQGRCDYTDVLDILEQVVAALEYAHRKGVIHGTLKPSNIVLDDDQNMLVAGFGLMHMLQMRGVEQDNRPYGHLLSIADTFLAAPEYIAPEIVQGQSIDKRSDIYALGIILFELLSGKPPFSGPKPLDVAKMHIEQSIPSLRMLYPDIPMAVVSVINQALDRDPARRFQSASELAEAFAQAAIGASGRVQRVDQASQATPSQKNNALPETPAQGYATGNWQLMPPIVTGKVASVNLPPRKPVPPAVQAAGSSDSWQFLPPVVTGHLEALDPPVRSGTPRTSQQEPPRLAPPVKPRVVSPPTLIPPPDEPVVRTLAASYSQPQPVVAPMRESRPEEKKQEWWEQPAQPPLVLAPSEANQWGSAVADANQWGGAPAEADQWGGAPDWSQSASTQRARTTMKRNTRKNSARNNSMRNNSMRNNSARNNPIGRRKVIAMLATGGIVAAGVVVGVRLNLNTHAPATATATAKQQPANTTPKQQPAKTNGAKAQPPKAPPPKTQPAKAQPPKQPKATVIGSKAMAPNSSVVFNNNQDLLIRLANGNFVAYNRACTHQGVPINYDPTTQHMICPLHGATFDPAQNAKVLLGPATTPVKAVKVSVNNDGTITMV